MSPLRTSIAVLLALSLPAFAQNKNGQLPERTEVDILKTVTAPEGFEVTVFAPAPKGGYPIQCSAAIDGTLFVAVDENGSLGRDRNPAPGVEGPKDGRTPGKVVRMRDTDGDGKADEFVTFCNVESPRGVIWDGNGMGKDGKMPGTIYVMHPPNLTAYTDVDGDGKADKQEDILTGLGFDLDFRGADHTTNGCRLAIDGFIYIAMGDYGCVKAVGKDGRTISHRGGGVVRIRPDGTGLELVAEGTRNILDVAVSPTLDIFTRDNTNDGGNWNVRLSFIQPGAHMGYPFLFKNFPEDMIDAMADFGGGSPCGSIWLDESGLPKGLFTVEWGAGGIFYHDDLVQNGAGWKLTNAVSTEPDPTSVHKRPPVKQTKWMGLTRPTDMDVDAAGRLYVTSWEGATFNYNGPYAGYIVRMVKKDAPKVEVPEISKAEGVELLKLLATDSGTVRLAVQREILRRKDPSFVARLAMGAAMHNSEPLRIAAIFTSYQLAKSEDVVRLSSLANNPALIEPVLKAMGDNPNFASVPTRFFAHTLADANPRVRAAALTALRRLEKKDAAPAILPLVADADPVVAHLAVRTLSALKAAQPCLGALDSSDAKVQPGALKALYGIYEPAVADGLIARLPGAKGELRRGILNALCRLANADAPYEDPKVWWGTRPDTSGPVYQPIAWSETEKITGALKAGLEKSDAEDAKWLVARMYQTKVNFPGLVEQMLAKAGNDTLAKLTAIEGMIRNDNSLPAEGLAALKAIALNDKEAPELQARALRIFIRCAENGGAFPSAVEAFAPLAGRDLPNSWLKAVFEDFTRGANNAKWVGDYKKHLEGTDAAKRQLAATVLVNLSTGRVGRDNEREAAKKAVEGGFKKPETAAALLAAIARTGAKALAPLVEANLNNPNNSVAEAALFAHQKLGLGGAQGKQIATMKYEEVFAAVQKGGDAKTGSEMFLKAGCIACHTIDSNEPLKGPVLSAVAKIYDRATLTESILKPSAKIAQGFETTTFKTKKGEQIEGFVTREGGDSVDVRNIAGQTVTLEKGDIAERGTRPQSMMPEGLLAPFTTSDLANLLAWLESLKK
ncbi:MAG: c-type cytochrome [Chthoniobacteraceae bacterium]